MTLWGEGMYNVSQTDLVYTPFIQLSSVFSKMNSATMHGNIHSFILSMAVNRRVMPHVFIKLQCFSNFFIITLGL